MKAVLSRLGLAVLLVSLGSSFGYAQVAKASLTGLVKDSQGGGVPGAKVTVKNVGTGVATETMTNGTGNWAVPSLDIGTYEVSISLANFKTVKYDKVVLSAGGSSNLNTTLEVGGVTEEIKVTAQTQLVETSNTNVTATMSADMMNSLPQVTKNALQFVTFLPGVNAGTNHVQRSSTIMGLPPAALAITLDGVNVMDQYLKDTSGSSFFAIIRPQTDLIEEVTVSEATPGADSSAGGAVQIKFVTRSGSNQPNGSAYEYLRHPALNTNAFTNTAAFGTQNVDLGKNQIIVNQYGFRQGGPIVIPGLYDGHGKAFYFFNYEEFRLPSSATRTRTVVAPLAQNGIFSYGCSSVSLTCTQTINLFTVAAAYAAANPTGTLNGLSAQPLGPAVTAANNFDPTVQNMLAFINQATGVQDFVNTGVPLPGSSLKFNTDRNTLAYVYQPPALRAEHIPGGRVDFNLTSKQRLSATYQFQKVNSNPDELNGRESTFPGGPNHGSQYSFRNSGTATLRSTITANIVNEVGWGMLWDPVYFFADITPSQFDLSSQFVLNLAGVGTSPYVSANKQGRNGSNYSIHDTVSWLKGKHSFSFGFNYQQITGWNFSQNVVPNVNLGLDTNNDPAAGGLNGGGGMFTASGTACNFGGGPAVCFPGATSGELGTARAIYAMLTGRVTSISGTSRRNPDGTYSFEGPGREDLRQREMGLFVQDQWHLKSNVTLNLGVRWEVQFPIVPTSAVYSQNNLADVCGQSGIGPIVSTGGPEGKGAVEALAIGLPCSFGVPGFFQAAGAPYTYTLADVGTNTGVGGATITSIDVGTTKCLNPRSNTSSPSALSTVRPCPFYVPYTPGTGGWTTHWGNFGPSLGLAWQPNVQHGFGRKLLGDPALATVRASYARSYNIIGISTLQGPLENGPGLTFNSARTTGNGNLCNGNGVQAGAGGNNCFPFLFTPNVAAGTIGPAADCTTTSPAAGCVPVLGLTFPLPNVYNSNGVWAFDPNYGASYSDSYSVGLQRSLSKESSIEIRWIRTRSYGGDTYREFANQNAFTAPFGTSSSFMDEFAKAQQNLMINIKNGCGQTAGNICSSFAPQAGNGPNGFMPGQSALPIFLASYMGINNGGSTSNVGGCGVPTAVYAPGGTNASLFCPAANTVAAYGISKPGFGTNQWTNSTGSLSLLNPNVNTFSLTGTSSTTDLFWNPTFRTNAIAAGMPINFWVNNPDTGFNGVETAEGFTKYDSIQVIYNRRLSRGLQVSANYAWQIQYGSAFLNFFQARPLLRSSGAAPNAYKVLVNYDLPVGRGKRFGTNMPGWVDAIIGNWQLNLTARVENGRLVDIGNVNLANMSLNDVQGAFHYYRNTRPVTIRSFDVAQNAWVNTQTVPDGRWYNLPLDIVINTQRAFSFQAGAAGLTNDANGIRTQWVADGRTGCTMTIATGLTTNQPTCGGPDPLSRHFEPASTRSVDAAGNVTGCSFLFENNCGMKHQFLVAPLFTRFEFSAKKRFPFARRGSFDIEIDALNLFNAIDFNSAFSATGGNNIVGSAYQDVSNTFDPGGRLLQLVFRINW